MCGQFILHCNSLHQDRCNPQTASIWITEALWFSAACSWTLSESIKSLLAYHHPAAVSWILHCSELIKTQMDSSKLTSTDTCTHQPGETRLQGPRGAVSFASRGGHGLLSLSLFITSEEVGGAPQQADNAQGNKKEKNYCSPPYIIFKINKSWRRTAPLIK